MPERINIEAEFPAAVRAAGGQVVEDLLETKSPTFSNADYLFPSWNTIAELKCLDKNMLADDAFRSKLAGIYGKLMNDGRAPRVFGRVNVTLEQIARIDQRAALEFIEPFKQRLGAILVKANKQIRETGSYFKMTDPHGLLIIANDGDLGFEMDLVFHLLDRLLKGRCTSVTSVLYFTANCTVSVPGFQPSQVWAPAAVSDRVAINPELMHRLHAAWMNRVARVTGAPVLTKTMDGSVESVTPMRFTDGQPPHLVIPARRQSDA